MIELSANVAVLLYLSFTIIILLGLWSYHHYSSRSKKVLPPPCELLICEYCQFAYLEKDFKAVTRCPQCGSFNKR